jgi:urease accessory protein
LDAPLQDFAVDLGFLRLLHLADSALPIGALAHSFGLESLVAEGLLGTCDLPEFFAGFLEEAGMVDAVFCREGWRVAAINCAAQFERAMGGAGYTISPLARHWVAVNDRLSALKPARESRTGSASLGRNFLNAVMALRQFAVVNEALQASKEAGSLVHHATAFGLAGAVLGFEEDHTVLAYLHQSMASLVSACQRLLPLGQTAATKILWDLKPAILETAKRSQTYGVDDACCFTPLVDWAAMEHPALGTRLFIS